MSTPNRISKLVALWYEVIGGMHHKDRDCHFYVSAHWRYSGEMVWELEHNGYLLGDIEESFKDYESAHERLGQLLIAAIRDWIDCDDTSVTAARRNEILKELKTL